MNVVIGLKLTGGWTSGGQRARACAWGTTSTVGDWLLLPLSVSLSSPQWDQAKRRQSTPATPSSALEEKTGEGNYIYVSFFFFFTPCSRGFSIWDRAHRWRRRWRRREDDEQRDRVRGGRGGSQQPGWVTRPGPAAVEDCARERVRARVHVWVRGKVRGGNKIMPFQIRLHQRVRRLQTGVDWEDVFMLCLDAVQRLPVCLSESRIKK